MVRAVVVGVAGAVALGALGVAAVVGLADGRTDAASDGEPLDCPDLDAPAGSDAGPLVVPPSAGTPAAYTIEVVDRLPHDESAFTQGLIHAGGLLYEGTGEYGGSRIRLLSPPDGAVLVEQALPDAMFGEGIAAHDGRLYQLTWREQTVLVRDRCSLSETSRLTYQGEGWGLTGDGDVLWRSDGTGTLTAHDPSTFAVVRTVDVQDRGQPVTRLNELELVAGQILANVWQTPWIARIDPSSGQVTAWIDASPLVDEVGATDPDEVLNGIAVDPASGRLWLTGKRWPTVFEVDVVAGQSAPRPGEFG
ncbi:MAG: glutaminyl-peptide cyclotransferase [Jiangellaceae bacterium]